nr:MAG: internal scaffolding protein [Microvirus sp.]
MHITNHHELRKSVTIDCSEPKITDQSAKRQCDINVIMANYAKTGLLPISNNREPRYIDNSTIPSLEAAFNIVNAASEAFNSLPANIRKLMDNDPSNLEFFVQNPDNRTLLEQHGMLISKIPTQTTTTKENPPASEQDAIL